MVYLQPDGKDIETDVVVIGTGPGGLSSVGSAVKSGAQVVAIEAHDWIGGNGLLSTGWIAFVNSRLQRDQGIKDSPELFMKDNEKLLAITSTLYPIIWDKELTQLYAERSAEMYDALTERGVRFTRLIKRPSQTSVDRLAAVEDTGMFPLAFQAEFNGPHVKKYVKCTADKILLENGEVRGVRVQPRAGPSFNVYARKGVILASGGYGANPALRRRLQLDPDDMSIYSGLPTCRGDGHLMGQAVGGDLINMTMIPPIVAVASHLTEESIAVNLDGRRFHDEAGPYYDRVYALNKQQDKKGYYVFDHRTYESKTKYVKQMAGELLKANSLKELAEKLGVPQKALEESVKQWNEFLESGRAEDPVTGRVQFAPERRPISVAPFYSKPMSVGVSLTCGGFLTTKSMQVIDIWGKPIPKLFAVGDVAGGLTPTAEMGGTHLGGGFVLGWVAGKAAATGLLEKPHHGKGTFGQQLVKNKNVDLSMPIISVEGWQQKGSKL